MPSASVLGCGGAGKGWRQRSGRSVSVQVQGCVVGGQVAAGHVCTLACSHCIEAPSIKATWAEGVRCWTANAPDCGGGMSCSLKTCSVSEMTTHEKNLIELKKKRKVALNPIKRIFPMQQLLPSAPHSVALHSIYCPLAFPAVTSVHGNPRLQSQDRLEVSSRTKSQPHGSKVAGWDLSSNIG